MTPRFVLQCIVALATLFALSAVLWFALRGPAAPDARFDTLTDVKGSPTAHWLPSDLPENATHLTVTTDLEHNRVSFTYRAPVEAVPPSCTATGEHAWSCGGGDDDYTLTYDPGSERWFGRIAF